MTSHQQPVLSRAMAHQLGLDLGDVIGNVITIAADCDEPTQAQALRTLAKLQIVRNSLEDAVRQADRSERCGGAS